jgi:hypothetical protein
MKADWKKSLTKGVMAVLLFIVGAMVAGLAAQPELAPVYGGALIAVLNFIKHEYLIG